MGMNVDGYIGTSFRECGKCCQRNKHFIADTVDIHNHPGGILLRQLAAQMSDHTSSTKSTTPMTAASIGDSTWPTEVMAEKPSCTARTRSPTPASTASTATM